MKDIVSIWVDVGIMDALVVISAALRALLVTVLFVINCSCVVKLVCHGRGGSGVHNVISGIVYLSSMLYLTSWIPFVLYGLFNGSIIYLASDNYCRMQYVVTNSLGILLLVLLLVHGFEKIRIEVFHYAPLGSETSASFIMIIWTLAQLLWCVQGRDTSVKESFHFLEHTTHSDVSNGTLVQCRIRFMICEVELFPESIHNRFVQYLCTVFPIAFFSVCIALVLGIYRCRRRFKMNVLELTFLSGGDECRPGCSQLVVIDLVLFTNLAWLAVVQPLMLAQAFSRVHGSANNPTSFLDIGSHLVLTISAVFAPFNGRQNWFSTRHAPISVFVVCDKSEKESSNVMLRNENDFYDKNKCFIT